MTDNWSCFYCKDKDRLIKELKDMLDVVTDLADHRWKALNDIYSECNDYHEYLNFASWAKQRAAEGLHLKK